MTRVIGTRRVGSTLAQLVKIILSVPVMAMVPVHVTAQPTAFKDPATNQWGYRSPSGGIAIHPQFLGAGDFRNGRAPVQDASGFAIIDQTGGVVGRIRIDSLISSGPAIRPPSERCEWREAPESPSIGLECYMTELGLDTTASGGIIRFTTAQGEGARSVRVLQAPSGAVLVELQGYEGFSRRVALPGVHPDSAAKWLEMLYPTRPVQRGCSESWRSGQLIGGAFIEQRAGC